MTTENETATPANGAQTEVQQPSFGVPATEVAPTAEGNVDYKALSESQATEIEDLQRKDKDLMQRVRSAEGRLRGAADPGGIARVEAEIGSLKREIRWNQVEQADLEPEEKTRQQQVITTEGVQALEAKKLIEAAEKLASRLDRRMATVGMDNTDEIVAQALTEWRQAKSVENLDRIYDKLDAYIDDYSAKQTNTKIAAAGATAQAERQAEAREEGTLAVGSTGVSSPSASVVATAEDIDKLYMDHERENPNKPNPYEDKYRHFRRTGKI